MSIDTFHVGEIVDVTIRGARVMAPLHTDDGLTLAYEEVRPGNFATFGLRHPQAGTVTIERVAPAEWPPQAGDLWRDKHNELWFIHRNPSVMDPSPVLMGRTTGGARWTNDVVGLIDDNAPMTLVHREPSERTHR